uniref:ORF 6 n=1 Tax=Spodoptera frugiperda TaxID=7108 RepID=A0A2U7Q1A2_SPOFR|nr:ORF 6 [Spodoptera frugiperda]DAC81445.1 TPA_asm: penton [Spodoptera moth adintovirus 1]
MSLTLSITGNSSTLTTYYPNTLQLNGQYECALLHFSTFNSIPNIDETNNKFYYGSEIIEIPEGTYELQDISDYLKSEIKGTSIKLDCNNNTLKTTLYCSKDVNFEKENTFRRLLGFDKQVLKGNKWHVSQFPVNILPTTVVRIECDIISGSYINGEPSHIIHEFALNVPPGYRIIEIPKNAIYFPINQNNISCIHIRLLDINNRLINLRGEEVQVYLHLRRKND